jgi:lysophospholipase L1-like esterase
MGRRDSTQRHQRFGALSSFSRFTPILPDSVSPDPQSVRTARVVLRPNKRSYGRAREWNVCRVYFGWHRAPVTIGLEHEGTLASEEVFQPGATLMTREWRFPSPPTEVTLSFSGADSPDIYAISLEGGPGVCMDNIAARGGAGYEFRTMDQQLLGAMYDQLDVKLLILQYGGNVLPHMKSAEEAAQYGRAFGAQIRRFKQLIRGVKVIVIGPSDMSIKEGEQYVTRPYLEEVRDALKANTLAEGGAFWDLYEAMGGRGSMVSWVEAVPPLSATDYTHFTPLGAKKVGELFYSALINDHAAYLATKPVTKKEAVKKPMSKTPSNETDRP